MKHFTWTFNIVLFAYISVFIFSCSSQTDEQVKTKVVSLNTEARLLLQEKNYSKSLIAIDQSIDLIDTIPDSHLIKGKSLLGLKEFKKAKKSFSRAIDLEGNNSKGYYFRALSHLGLEDGEDYLDDINLYLKNHPSDTSALISRAKYYFSIEDNNNSINDYLRVYKIDINSKSTILQIAKIYSILDQNEKSINYYDKYSLLIPESENKTIEFTKAKLLLDIRKYTQSLEKFLFLDSVNFRDKLIYKLIADTYIGLKSDKEAIFYLNKYIIENPKDYIEISKRASLHYNLDNQIEGDNDSMTSAGIKWKNKSMLSKYLVSLLLTLGLLAGAYYFKKIAANEYDRKSIKKGYLFFIFWPFALHHIYLNQKIIFFILFTFKVTLLFYFAFELINFTFNPRLLLISVNSNNLSINILVFIFIIFVIDLITLPVQIFISNVRERLMERSSDLRKRSNLLNKTIENIKISNNNIKLLFEEL